MKVYNLTQYEHGADDVLVMGTDGLWDVLSNQEVAEAVTTFLANCDPDDLHRSAFFFSFFCLVNYGFVALNLESRRLMLPVFSSSVFVCFITPEC